MANKREFKSKNWDPRSRPATKGTRHKRPRAAPADGRFVQVDVGSFAGRQGRVEEVVWVWRPPANVPSPQEAEVWIWYKPGDSDGFQKFGDGAMELQLTQLANGFQSGVFDPVGFRDFVMRRKNDNDASHYTLNVYSTAATTNPLPNPSGQFVPAVYEVFEDNHPNADLDPVAFVWRPSSVHDREIWLLVDPGQDLGYWIPGEVGTGSMVYSQADFSMFVVAVNTSNWNINDPAQTDFKNRMIQHLHEDYGLVAYQFGDLVVHDGHIIQEI